MPTAEAPGKLKNRDDKKLVNTDKEKVSRSLGGVQLLQPELLRNKVLFCCSRPCSSLRKVCTSSCPRSAWPRAAAWTSSSSPASTWTWPPWLTCPRTPAAPSTSTTTFRYNPYQANVLISLGMRCINAAICWLKFAHTQYFAAERRVLCVAGGGGWRAFPERPEERLAKEHRV